VITTSPSLFLAMKADVPSWLRVVRVLFPTTVTRVAPRENGMFASLSACLMSIVKVPDQEPGFPDGPRHHRKCS